MSNTCKYWDCGWCYAPDNIQTNANEQSACVNPFVCPAVIMNNKTEIKYWVTWKSGIQRTASFTYLQNAETWYDEKLAEGKKPQLWKEKIATTFEAMRPIK